MGEVPQRTATILLVEDDEEDRWATTRAFEQSKLPTKLHCTVNGQEALDFLYNRGAFEDRHAFPRPDLILLDLNMPVIDGHEVLRQVKADISLRSIPVVVMTTSEQEGDILRTYDLGVNSFITKPVVMDKFVETVRDLGRYWLEIVSLPPKN